MNRDLSEVKKEQVEDEEIVYRCIFYGKGYYRIKDNSAHVSSQAFNDRNQKPSVDRAKLCNNDPHHTQIDSRDGVVSLVVKDIRAIDNVTQNDVKGNPEFIYKIDVIYRPSPKNIAHAQIEPSPEYRNKKPFDKKLKERLAYLANQRGWEIKPYELRNIAK